MPEYKVPYGYKVSVRINRDLTNDNAEVIVIAPFYMNKEWKMPHSYSCSFSDQQILKDYDFISTMLDHYPIG
jgi:hypothetical protein